MPRPKGMRAVGLIIIGAGLSSIYDAAMTVIHQHILPFQVVIGFSLIIIGITTIKLSKKEDNNARR